MKDVEGCDKPREAVKQALIRGFPNGETQFIYKLLLPEYIEQVEGTRGSETSQYLEERKAKATSLSSGERNGKSLNQFNVKTDVVVKLVLRDLLERASDLSISQKQLN